MHAFQAVLRNGTRVRIRPVEPGDEGGLAVLLGPRPRATRASGGRPQRNDLRNDVAWVAVAMDDPGQTIVGAARYVQDGVGGTKANATVAVTSGFRRQGLGRLLLETLMLVALETGVARLLVRVPPENPAGVRLLRGLGARVTHAADGSLEYELPVGWGERTLASSSGFRAPRPEHLRVANQEG
jgi:acetyltransferase